MKTGSLQADIWEMAGELAAALADAERFDKYGTRKAGFRVVDALGRVIHRCDGIRRICLDTMEGHASWRRRRTPSEYLDELRQKAESRLKNGGRDEDC